MAGHGQVSYSPILSLEIISLSTTAQVRSHSDNNENTRRKSQLLQPSPVPPGGPQGAPVPSPLYPWMRSQFGEFADGECAWWVGTYEALGNDYGFLGQVTWTILV